MQLKNEIIVTTDDVCPQYLSNWKYWDNLKNEFPGLKLNAFVTPFLNRSVQNLILLSPFVSWYKENSSWVKLHLHGLDHSYPPECTRSFEEQATMLMDGKEILKTLVGQDITFGFRPPGFHYNRDTIKAMMLSQLDFLANKNFIIGFKKYTTEKKYFSLINTHLSNGNPDSVSVPETIDWLRKEFSKDPEFVLL